MMDSIKNNLTMIDNQLLSIYKNFHSGKSFNMKVSKKEIEKLLSEGVIRNTRRGYVDRRGEHIGYYKTCGGKRYIEDKYVK